MGQSLDMRRKFWTVRIRSALITNFPNKHLRHNTIHSEILSRDACAPTWSIDEWLQCLCQYSYSHVSSDVQVCKKALCLPMFASGRKISDIISEQLFNRRNPPNFDLGPTCTQALLETNSFADLKLCPVCPVQIYFGKSRSWMDNLPLTKRDGLMQMVVLP